MSVGQTALPDIEQRIVRLVRARQVGARDVRVSALRTLSGGNARRAWSFDVRWSDAGGPHERECVLLARAEAGQLDASIECEFDTLAAVSATDLPVPRPLWLDATGVLLGVPGFVMSRGEGRSGMSELLKPGCEVTRPLMLQLVQIAANLHTLGWQKLHPRLSANAGWVDVPRRELLRWEDQFRRNRMEPLPALASVFGWLHRHLPVAPPVLVHGDFRVGNFLHDGQRVTMLLDWEMAHLSHPMEDIAWAYRDVWSPKAFLPLEECVAAYERASGRAVDPGQLTWWRIFSEAKFAVISLNAARIFAAGASSNLRLAARASMVNECVRSSLDWIAQLEAA